ncbi:MAG: preprotein translocase subunit SecA [Cellvibrionaceae bacterium]
MIGKAFRSVFGTKNDRELRKMGKIVQRINAQEDAFQALSDEELKHKTVEFRDRFANGESLDDLLPEAFAAVREASKRTLGLRHFDVQMIGGITLHEGRIAEMRTGEGKTLVATLPAYLNAIPAQGVHLITVNDYLASRDANWMAPIYEFLGMSVGVIQSMQSNDVKREAYQADITYGTNNEFGFDYLRDNMALRKEDKSQRELHFAIVDEVDSILIDEARTPLIISGAAQDSSESYKRINRFIPKLKRQMEVEEGVDVEPGDYVIDEKSRQVELTEQGHQVVEEMMTKDGLLEENDSLYAATNLGLLHHIHSALRAHVLFQKNVDYIVQDNEVVLIDEHTGRTMAGRRLSEGLHQAIEAKENVTIQSESQTLASTTFQNYFRLYDKLAGMTGTADTEAYEFREIYGLDVVVIPTNKEVSREDLNDLVYLSIDEKYAAVIEDIRDCQKRNAPVLVGVGSIETSEEVSRRLEKAGIEHKVLNAKYHEKEADIIAQAGRPGAITIATNMAGRGTDIMLGGNWESEVAKLDNPTKVEIESIKSEWQKRHATVIEANGLHIICTERNESRRIDNQFRGRAGRQGDPGVSRFYLSMEDNLMRIFASERMRGIMQAIGLEKGEAIEHRMVSNAIEKAQRKVEGRNFDIRKQLLEYDDVANDQRQVVYQQRQDLLDSDSIEDAITSIRREVVNDTVSGFIPPQSIEEQWDISGLEQHLSTDYGLSLPIKDWLDSDKNLHEDSLREKILDAAQAGYDEKCERFGTVIREIEKQIMLQVLDNYWKEHLSNMDHLRQGIGLRAYAQKNPKQEYKREAFEMFQGMLSDIQHEVIKVLARVEPMTQEQVEEMERRQREALEQQKMQLQHAEASALSVGDDAPVVNKRIAENKVPQQTPFVREGQKLGRNEPCPCGSGKKYKQCHGKLS